MYSPRHWLRMVLMLLVGNLVRVSAGPSMAADGPAPPLRKALDEQRIALPEYFGLYAVVSNGASRLLDRTIARLDDPPAGEFGPEVEFLVYGQAPGLNDYTLLALPAPSPVRKMPAARQKSFSWDDWMQQMVVDGPANEAAALTGIPRGATAVRLLVKPVSGQPQMLRLIPAVSLAPGIYQIGSQIRVAWYRFQVGAGAFPARNILPEGDSGTAVALPANSAPGAEHPAVCNFVADPPQFLKPRVYRTHAVLDAAKHSDIHNAIFRHLSGRREVSGLTATREEAGTVIRCELPTPRFPASPMHLEIRIVPSESAAGDQRFRVDISVRFSPHPDPESAFRQVIPLSPDAAKALFAEIIDAARPSSPLGGSVP